MKKIINDESVCIGCHLCEVHCQAAHSVSKDLIKAFREEKTPLPRIRVTESKPLTFALQCRHCKSPDCVYSCLTGAMYVDASGAVLHDPGKCIGCYTCILVCPYGAIRKDTDPSGKKIVSKCDLCAGRGNPACVENCPNGALKAVER